MVGILSFLPKTETAPDGNTSCGVMLVLKTARAKGCHVGMAYLAHALSYAEPVPIEPADEAADLQRQFIESASKLADMAEKIQRLQARDRGLKAVVA